MHCFVLDNEIKYFWHKMDIEVQMHVYSEMCYLMTRTILSFCRLSSFIWVGDLFSALIRKCLTVGRMFLDQLCTQNTLNDIQTWITYRPIVILF